MPDAALVRRIPFDELPTSLITRLRSRVERLGYLGEFFQCCAHQPEALGHFIDLTEALKEALPAQLMEVVALTAATVLANEYERTQHERLCMSLGYGQDWVTAVELGARGRVATLPEPLATCQRYVARACEPDGPSPSEPFDELCRLLGAPAAIAVAMTAARYSAHALIVRSLGLAAPVRPISEGGA